MATAGDTGGRRPGIYGLDYGGKIIWYHPVPGLAGLAADQEGGKILVHEWL